MARARITAAYATVPVLDDAGKPTMYGFYAGALLPESASADAVERLVRRGYAEWVQAAPEPEPEVAEEKPARKSTAKAAE